jgi:ATP-dependent Clp protease adaptor protein ClpS
MSDQTTIEEPPAAETAAEPAAKTVVQTKPAVDTDRRTKKQPPYNVVLLDDNDHSYDYVVRMCRNLFAMSEQKAYLAAVEVDSSGRVILLTTTREHAELKRDQIHGLGADRLIARCAGAMSAIIEPAKDPD